MALISMKQKPEREEMPGEVEADEPQYPYGLCLHLGKDELDKLDVKDLPEVGTPVMVQAKAFVKSTSAYNTQGDGKSMSVELQITDMEIMPGEKKDPASVMYPGD